MKQICMNLTTWHVHIIMWSPYQEPNSNHAGNKSFHILIYLLTYQWLQSLAASILGQFQGEAIPGLLETVRGEESLVTSKSNTACNVAEFQCSIAIQIKSSQLD